MAVGVIFVLMGYASFCEEIEFKNGPGVWVLNAAELAAGCSREYMVRRMKDNVGYSKSTPVSLYVCRHTL